MLYAACLCFVHVVVPNRLGDTPPPEERAAAAEAKREAERRKLARERKVDIELELDQVAEAVGHVLHWHTSGFHISHNALKSVTFWRISLCGILHIIMYGYITPKNR